ncbi:MAG: hypothetical protein H6832_13810 [Planctomycetes bacterium]|nr:hypothetical protein [Planctomycetota bacterium]MCB9891269.1 hypothetical protein [Planctomycetota bacterium]MCB9919472.1 hypothetical protein [Planctomycetota bacterium]
MDIGILDFGGNFAGAALGLLAQGFEVSYFRTGPRKPQESLLARLGWEVSEPYLRADLVIVAGSFADEAWAYELGIQREAPLAPEDPFFFSINPLQRRVRDRWLEPRLRECEHRLAVVDMSDCGEMLDPFLAQHGNWKFKRELPAYGFDVPVEPFPFLYHPTLLTMEWSVGLDRLELPHEARQSRDEIFFAGTLQHWRYFGRRRALIHRFQKRFPRESLRVIENGMTCVEVWNELQLARAGLYLPGRGELCFRLHECAAFGVPLVAAEELSISVPDAWTRMLPTDPSKLRSSAEVLAFYHKHYHPIRAAQWLLERIGLAPSAIAPEPGFLDRARRREEEAASRQGEEQVGSGVYEGDDRVFEDVDFEIVDDVENWGLSDFLRS